MGYSKNTNCNSKYKQPLSQQFIKWIFCNAVQLKCFRFLIILGFLAFFSSNVLAAQFFNSSADARAAAVAELPSLIAEGVKTGHSADHFRVTYRLSALRLNGSYVDVWYTYYADLTKPITDYHFYNAGCPGSIPHADPITGECTADPNLAPPPPEQKQDPKLDCHGNPVVGDPIVVATGTSAQTETDYQSIKPAGLSFMRYYNSSASDSTTGIGIKWQHNYQQRLVVGSTRAIMHRANGRLLMFNKGTSAWQGDADISDTLVETVDVDNVRTGWLYTTDNDNVETYNASGQLTLITNRLGQTQQLFYQVPVIDGGDGNDTTLDKVVSFTGEELHFSHDSSQRLIGLTDPHGRDYSYSYDTAGNLINVTYPDDTPLDSADNPKRTYHYDNTTFPHHLTGLTDETGSRVTWAFDSEGRTISSELDGGVDKTTLDFSITDQVKVTNPLGKDTTYHFTTLHGVKKVTQVEGHATASCTAANQNYTYDANGYLASKTDWQGNLTTYVHDARGLQTSRTEASGTPQARTITTDWHATFRLPIKITEPSKITDFVYDAQGRQLSQTISAQ